MNSVFKIGFRATSLDCFNLELIIVEHLIAAIGGQFSFFSIFFEGTAGTFNMPTSYQ